MKQVTLQNATKSDDWKCTGGLNAGVDSYRVYTSEKVQERVVEDGKSEATHLKILKGEQKL